MINTCKIDTTRYLLYVLIAHTTCRPQVLFELIIYLYNLSDSKVQYTNVPKR